MASGVRGAKGPARGGGGRPPGEAPLAPPRGRSQPVGGTGRGEEGHQDSRRGGAGTADRVHGRQHVHVASPDGELLTVRPGRAGALDRRGGRLGEGGGRGLVVADDFSPGEDGGAWGPR